MTDQTLASPPAEGVPLQRLADSLRRLVPPVAAAPLVPELPKPSPAVAAALARATETARRAAQVRRTRSRTGVVVELFARACALLPYALVALVLRLVMARAFFLDGQLKVEGLGLPLHIQDFNFSLVLPLQVKAETFATFADLYAIVPAPPALAAYVVSFGEFALPLLLVLGVGTRFAALGLLLFTAMEYYVQPAELWTTHAYWAAILLVLVARGAGAISVDHVVRSLTCREDKSGAMA